MTGKIQKKETVFLLAFSLGSFALSYGTAIVFARALGANGYDDYAVAISSAVILSTLAEMGTGKYALRIIPAYSERRDWSAAHGYIRFSAGLILVTSSLLAIAGTAWEYFKDGQFGNYALGFVLLFLPIMAWVGAGSELLTANRAAIQSAFITRLLVPGATLIFAIIWVASPWDLTASQGVLCYGTGWMAGLIAVFVFLKQTTREEIYIAPTEHRTREWLVSIWPFLYFALLISVLAKIGVIILEFVAPQEATVAVYSAAAETGTFIYIVAKSTDKLYLPTVSTMLEQKDQSGLTQGRWDRWAWLGSLCATFLLVIVIFGKQILGLFGPEFVDGYAALCITAFATVVWTMSSLAPSYLKYVQRQQFVVVATTLTVLAHIVLCIPLGFWYGATGAAISYAIPVITMYLTMAIMATWELRKMNEPS